MGVTRNEDTEWGESIIRLTGINCPHKLHSFPSVKKFFGINEDHISKFIQMTWHPNKESETEESVMMSFRR